MTRQEFEKALKDGVKEFVIKHRCSLGCEDTIVKLRDDDGSISPLFANKGGDRRWVFLSCLEPIYPELEFKVGDRVDTPWYDGLGSGTVIQIKGMYYIVLHDISRECLHSAEESYKGKIPKSARKNRCWVYLKGKLKHSSVPAPKPKQELTFSVQDNKVVVKLTVDGALHDTAEAKCSPEDDFHLLTGAQIALQRLAEKTGSKIVVPKSALSDRVELI